jgi:integrase
VASIRENTLSGREPTWAVLFRHGTKQRSKTFKVKKEAEWFRAAIDTIGPDAALAALAEKDQRGSVTVAELAEQWFIWKARDLTPRALADYRRDYENWIDPFFGHRGAEFVTEGDVQKWVDRDLARLSPKTVADRHALLHGILAWASQRKRALITHNPCLETDLPKRSKKPPKGLMLPEWLALKEAAYRIDEDAADLILFMASTGWRIGEATALMALGVDDSGPKMYVSMTHVNRKGQGVVEGAKSFAGHRRLSVSRECAAMLRRRLVGLGPGDYVFTNSHSPTGLWEPSTFRNRWWKKSVEAAGLADRHPTPHWLRHTHVLLCHMAGMSLAEIQRRIGHEDIKTTINVYGRMIDDMSDDVADKLDALLSGRVPQVVGGEVVNELR